MFGLIFRGFIMPAIMLVTVVPGLDRIYDGKIPTGVAIFTFILAVGLFWAGLFFLGKFRLIKRLIVLFFILTMIAFGTFAGRKKVRKIETPIIERA